MKNYINSEQGLFEKRLFLPGVIWVENSFRRMLEAAGGDVNYSNMPASSQSKINKMWLLPFLPGLAVRNRLGQRGDIFLLSDLGQVRRRESPGCPMSPSVVQQQCTFSRENTAAIFIRGKWNQFIHSSLRSREIHSPKQRAWTLLCLWLRRWQQLWTTPKKFFIPVELKKKKPSSSHRDPIAAKTCHEVDWASFLYTEPSIEEIFPSYLPPRLAWRWTNSPATKAWSTPAAVFFYLIFFSVAFIPSSSTPTSSCCQGREGRAECWPKCDGRGQGDTQDKSPVPGRATRSQTCNLFSLRSSGTSHFVRHHERSDHISNRSFLLFHL